MTQFTDLGLAAPLLRALTAEGYTTPTPIQAQAIPGVMQGRDLQGIAQTGTGKTAAFALPILHRLAADKKAAPRRGCRALVLSPTRELATQIAESFRSYGRHMGFSVAVIFGGVKYGAQTKALAAGVDILVATPGRLIDHMGQHTAFLGETEIFVLDEADQMLDLGFLVPIRRIVATLPKQRQNLFFSATMPTEIGKLAGEMLKDPLKVSVAPQSTTIEKVDQSIIFVESARKRALVAELFAERALARVIVFTRTKRGADRVAKYLEASGISAASIHGDKSQAQREKALAAFKAGACRALVATDIAARGIDVDQVSHVIQYELPNVPEAYVHRIGRTGRAGNTGIAISLCADDERNLLRDIQKVTRQTIPAFDRRNDRQLGAVAAATEALVPHARRDDDEAAGPKHQHNRNRGRPAGNGGGGRQGQGQGRSGHSRPADPRSGEGQAAKAHAHGRGGNAAGQGQGQGRGRGPGQGRPAARPADGAAKPRSGEALGGTRGWSPLDG